MKEINLELLGLNKYEARAYEALVRLGKAGASDIARDSGVPYGRIYDVLNSLVSKSLVIIIPEKAKKFAPASPDALEKLLFAHLRNIEKVQAEIKNLKSIYVPAAEEPIEIVKGRRNFYKLIHKMPESRKYKYAYKFTSEVLPAWISSTKKQLRNGVDVRTFVKYSEETKPNIEKWQKLVPKLKQKEFDFDKVAGQIIDGKAVFFALVESNTTVLIRDKPFARLMKKLFEAAWEKAEEV